MRACRGTIGHGLGGQTGEVHVPDGNLLSGFVAAALVVLIIPGPGVFYTVARTLARGTAPD